MKNDSLLELYKLFLCNLNENSEILYIIGKDCNEQHRFMVDEITKKLHEGCLWLNDLMKRQDINI